MLCSICNNCTFEGIAAITALGYIELCLVQGDARAVHLRALGYSDLCLVVQDDMHVRVFNYNTLERVHQFEAHSDYLRSIAVHPTQPYVLTSSGMYHWLLSFFLSVSLLYFRLSILYTRTCTCVHTEFRGNLLIPPHLPPPTHIREG